MRRCSYRIFIQLINHVGNECTHTPFPLLPPMLLDYHANAVPKSPRYEDLPANSCLFDQQTRDQSLTQPSHPTGTLDNSLINAPFAADYTDPSFVASDRLKIPCNYHPLRQLHDRHSHSPRSTGKPKNRRTKIRKQNREGKKLGRTTKKKQNNNTNVKKGGEREKTHHSSIE